jgi:general secretion pathway protein A
MYLEYYGLKTFPFNITANPDFFYKSRSHEEALAALSYGIAQRKGIMSLTGEVGTGKTTVCKALLGRLEGKAKTSLILNPFFNQHQLLVAVLQDFGVKPTETKSKLGLINQLNNFLIEANAAQTEAVLVIDEAQNLSASQLEQIRLLSNLETTQDKLLQVVLSGQPELEQKLAKHNLRQLKQRISVKCSLSPLKKEEIEEYVRHRLTQAGKTDLEISPRSFETIFIFSEGIPRLINALCDRAMLCGFARDTKNLTHELFAECVKELQ